MASQKVHTFLNLAQYEKFLANKSVYVEVISVVVFGGKLVVTTKNV